MPTPITKTITATEIDDELNVRCMVFVCEVSDPKIDLIMAMKSAATEFCQSDEGKHVYSGNCHSFNWGDFAIYVPERYQKKHGFIVTNVIGDDAIIRDFNEQLVCEMDIFPEE